MTLYSIEVHENSAKGKTQKGFGGCCISFITVYLALRSAPRTELGNEVILVNIPCYPNILTFSALTARDALLGRCIYNTAFIQKHRHTRILVRI